MSIKDQAQQPLSAPGTTVTARLAYWRRQSWAQLMAHMQPPDPSRPPAADGLPVTPVQVTGVTEQPTTAA